MTDIFHFNNIPTTIRTSQVPENRSDQLYIAPTVERAPTISVPYNTSQRPLGVLTIPAFKDNYFWLIHNERYAVVIDPGDANEVIAALLKHKLQLIAILITHHHADHTGGVLDLVDFAKAPVFGPENPNIAGVTHKVKHADYVCLPELNLEMQALAVPGHTLDHLTYVAISHGWMFCGDTLFAAGCGRVFEGTPEQMYSSLQLLAQVPDSTLIFCAHEYTLSNLRFAVAAEPENRMLQSRLKVDTDKRAHSRPTVPSNMGLEKRTNPFLRCTEPGIIRNLQALGKLGGEKDPVAVFTALREWKNNFR